MRIAFGIVSLFPGGGLQRNCLAIARILRWRGYDVSVFASRISGPAPPDLPITILPNNAWTNHGRDSRFASDFARATNGRFQLVVGFNKLPGLDVLYCADPSVAAQGRGWRWLTPRYHARCALEAACFSPKSKTRIIALSQAQIDAYLRVWATPAQRLALLPPNLEIERRHPERRTDGTRERWRAALGLTSADWSWLAIGRQARMKGFDRVIAALPAFPRAHLGIVGLDWAGSGASTIIKLARRLGVDRRITLHGLVSDEDVLSLMAAADLLVHPARLDTTGTVILEAIVNGLPVVTTAACGYACHVRKACAGVVVPQPFSQHAFRAALKEANDRARQAEWSVSGARYSEHLQLFTGLEAAAGIILRATRL